LKDKLQANRDRDEDTDRRLRASGWEPIRVWEHEDVHDAAGRIEAIVRARQASSGAAR
jgi:DNA mismatch endonuclease, patch repair protein